MRGDTRRFQATGGTPGRARINWQRHAVIALVALCGWFGLAAGAMAATAQPVFRFFNIQTGTHFYTISTGERDIVLVKWPQFVYEGPVFMAYLEPTADMMPVFRFFDTGTGTHFYTQSTNERDQFVASRPGFLYEASSTTRRRRRAARVRRCIASSIHAPIHGSTRPAKASATSCWPNGHGSRRRASVSTCSI